VSGQAQPTAAGATSEPAFSIDSDTFFTTRRPDRERREQLGRARRAEVPLSALATTPPPEDRPDALGILRGQESVREPALVPLRYERMSTDPFAYLRGAAAVMASDLSRVPTSDLRVQLCGDAHIANFGMFASAERSLVFDVNDFDETLSGPFDWDVRRLAASVAVAARAKGASDKKARKAAKAAAGSYRKVNAYLSQMRRMDLWNTRIDVDWMVAQLGTSDLARLMGKASAKSRSSTSDTALVKLTETVDGQRRFRSQPPLLIRLPEEARDGIIHELAPRYGEYLATLQADRLALLAHFSFVDLAHKVVGVGSVGTHALVMLLESGDGEPLLLQIKQANASVLEPYLGASRFDNSGKRVVVGQRVMQAAGDPFLGWMRGAGDAHGDYYVRQLRDLKGSVDVARLDLEGLADYGAVCAAILSRAHSRVGDSSMIAGYLGDNEEFEEAIAEFAVAYANITDADHAALVGARA
jgi:uncharacterized protein (DUF2252 family)